LTIVEKGQTTQWSKEKGQTTQWSKEKGQTTQWSKEKGQTTSLNIFYLLKCAKRIRRKLNKLMKFSPIYNKLQHY
jgi:hypothetical protein